MGVVTSQKLANAANRGIFFLSPESQSTSTLHRKPWRPTCAHGHELEHRVLRRMQWKKLERLCEEKQGILDIFLKALRSHRDTALMPPDISQQSGPAKAGPPFVYPNNPLEHSNGAKAGWLGG